MQKIYRFIIFNLYFFTIGFIILITINKDYNYNIYLYSGAIWGIIYILFYWIINSKKKSTHYYDNFDITLNIIIKIYCLISILETILIKNSSLIYTLFQIIPIYIFSLFIKDDYFKKNIKFIYKIVCNLFVLCSILALVLYFFGYSQINFSFKHFLNLIPRSQYMSIYGQDRLSFMCSHKSRFALFCMLGLGVLLLDKNKNNIKKIIFGTIFLIDIYFSNTVTTLFFSLIVIFAYLIFIKYKKINKLIAIPILIFSIILFFVLTNAYYINLSKERDLSTLGARQYIWKAATNNIKENPLGIIQMPNNYELRTEEYSVSFTNGHNVFINEILERGVICGFLYILIYILILFKFVFYNKKFGVCFLLSIMGCNMMDSTISHEMIYVFWCTIAVIYLKI